MNQNVIIITWCLVHGMINERESTKKANSPFVSHKHIDHSRFVLTLFFDVECGGIQPAFGLSFVFLASRNWCELFMPFIRVRMKENECNKLISHGEKIICLCLYNIGHCLIFMLFTSQFHTCTGAIYVPLLNCTIMPNGC